ncbi:MAG TPA: inositol oxygenase family protein, partial [Lacipirellulaceae bacterium]|nr:inositol oxygenase family protein [Lacipirellulaceae bacterium]
MNRSSTPTGSQNALHAWEEFIEELVYPTAGAKAAEDYRNYDNPARDTVREFYKQNHRGQTYDFVCQKRDTFLKLDRRRMSIFDALEFLNTLVDDSDPDIELDQLQHLLQTS